MRFKRQSSIAVSTLAASLLGGVVSLTPAVVRATDYPVAALSYAAKVVCEEETNSNVETKVNIHNPHYINLRFFWKAVEAEEVGTTDGINIVVHESWLGPDGAAYIDCDTLDLNDSEFEGYIVVISQKELDVVGVLEVETGDEEPEDIDFDRASPIKVSIPRAIWNSWPTPDLP